MARLRVRGLSEETVRRLRERAKAHGRSVEAEHRAILKEALGGQPTITTAEWIERLQGTFLAELDPAELRDNEPPREFHFDPQTGTTVSHPRHAPGHDSPDQGLDNEPATDQQT
jgi:plasmid stability protein